MDSTPRNLDLYRSNDPYLEEAVSARSHVDTDVIAYKSGD